MHDAQEKLAHAKHEMALELTTKQADIARLHSQMEELKARHGDDDEEAIVFAKVCQSMRSRDAGPGVVKKVVSSNLAKVRYYVAFKT